MGFHGTDSFIMIRHTFNCRSTGNNNGYTNLIVSSSLIFILLLLVSAVGRSVTRNESCILSRPMSALLLTAYTLSLPSIVCNNTDIKRQKRVLRNKLKYKLYNAAALPSSSSSNYGLPSAPPLLSSSSSLTYCNEFAVTIVHCRHEQCFYRRHYYRHH